MSAGLLRAIAAVASMLLGAERNVYTAEQADLGISVDSRVTWATPAQPEVHILLRNSGAEPVPFSLWIGELPGSQGLECDSKISGAVPDLTSRFAHWVGISHGRSRGIVPARGWAHRSILVGAQGGVAPCRVPYLLVTEGSGKRQTLKAAVDVPEVKATPHPIASTTNLRWEAMFERDESHRDRVIARVLVERNGRGPVDVSIRDRRLTCSSDSPISWSLSHGALQGEDVGPISLEDANWGVFVMPILTAGGGVGEGCVMELSFVTDTLDGPGALGEARFPISLSGEFGPPRDRGGPSPPRE